MALYSDLNLRAIQEPNNTWIVILLKNVILQKKIFFNPIFCVCYFVVLGDTEFLFLYAILGTVYYLLIIFLFKEWKIYH